MSTKSTPELERFQLLAIEIRDLIKKYQEKEDYYCNRAVITSIIKVVAPFLLNHIRETIEKNEGRKEFIYTDILSFYRTTLDNYMKILQEDVINYWGDENEH
jgi:hypothetical protein